MKKALQFIFLTMLLLSALNAFSQDTIVKIDGEIIQAKVLKITNRTIEYQRFDFSDGPLYILNKIDISEIKYKNGMVDKFNLNFGNYKRAIKFEMLSPLCGDFVFAYEQPILAHASAEIKLGIIKGANNISAGNFNNYSAQGIFVKAGLKLVPPENKNHFSGFYLKPEFIYSNYASKFEYQYNFGNQNTAFNYSTFGGDLVFGYQAIVSNHLLIDNYLGWGFAFTNISTNNPNQNNYASGDITNYGFSRFSDLGNNNTLNKYSSGIVTFGLLFGYAF